MLYCCTCASCIFHNPTPNPMPHALLVNHAMLCITLTMWLPYLTPSGAPFAMDVVPSSIVIPPHEYRCVTLLFNPTAIQTYSAIFEAVVEGGSDPKTSGFNCSLKGEGVLPSLSMQASASSSVRRTGQPLLHCVCVWLASGCLR